MCTKLCIRHFIVYTIIIGIFRVFVQSSVTKKIDDNLQLICNVNNDGRDIICRGLGLKTVDEALMTSAISSFIFNITKM